MSVCIASCHAWLLVWYVKQHASVIDTTNVLLSASSFFFTHFQQPFRTIHKTPHHVSNTLEQGMHNLRPSTKMYATVNMQFKLPGRAL